MACLGGQTQELKRYFLIYREGQLARREMRPFGRDWTYYFTAQAGYAAQKGYQTGTLKNHLTDNTFGTRRYFC